MEYLVSKFQKKYRGAITTILYRYLKVLFAITGTNLKRVKEVAE